MRSFQKFDNFSKFTLHTIETKFFYRSLAKPNNQHLKYTPISRFSIPFSNFYNRKDLNSIWDFLRSVFYVYKIYGNYKISNVKFFKRHFVFFISIQDFRYISFLISFFKRFKKRNNKLFSFLYLSPDNKNFSFFLRDSHLFNNLNSDIFDYYNWKPKLFLSFNLVKNCLITYTYRSYTEFTADSKLFLLYYFFNFSNKK